MATLFVSDLHLSADRPEKLALFEQFCDRALAVAEAVYILGDLFEIWIGDDDDDADHRAIVSSLRRLTAGNVQVYVAHGNRDFLFGPRFERDTGARLLEDYAVIDLYGTRTLLMHGDLLCTRDVKYQRFRRVVRNPILRTLFLSTPLAWRKRIAKRTQSETQASMAKKSQDIMDVEPGTVHRAMRQHRVELLIHGHTHRPCVHDVSLDGSKAQRIVLGDWYDQDDVLICDSAHRRSLRVSEFVRAPDAAAAGIN